MKSLTMLLRLALLALLAGPALADNKASATLYTRVEGGEVRAAIQIEIKPGWHLFHEDLGPGGAVGIPTSVEIEAEGVEWGNVRFPEPTRFEYPELDEWAWIHEGTLVLYSVGTIAPGATPGAVSARVKGQVCDDSSCLLYSETLQSAGAGPEDLFAAFTVEPGGDGERDGRASSDAGKTGAPERSRGTGVPSGMGLFLLSAIGWGLFALLMPCTYPMIPITISFFTKQASTRGGSALPLALAYGAGIVVVFIVVGLAFGSVIIPFAAHPITNLVIGLAFVVFALSLFGLMELQPPRFLMNAAGQATQVGGYGGVFLMGTTLVVTSFTCTAPFVGALLASGSQVGGVGRTALGMGVFGLTMAVPFALLALLPGRVQALPRSGEWMHTLKVFFGFVELAAALKFLSNVDLVWGWGFLSRELFLLLWFGVFLAAALFLLGLVRLSGERNEIGPGRLTSGVATLLLALYCGYGSLGRELDWIMESIAPPYHDRVLEARAGSSGAAENAPVIVVDDYDAARERARAEGKLLFVNFTGYT